MDSGSLKSRSEFACACRISVHHALASTAHCRFLADETAATDTCIFRWLETILKGSPVPGTTEIFVQTNDSAVVNTPPSALPSGTCALTSAVPGVLADLVEILKGDGDGVEVVARVVLDTVFLKQRAHTRRHLGSRES
jgi:hypothetical protein